jgi:hypothetical protein
VGDLEAFKPFESKSTKVTVRENGREQAELNVIEPER